MSKHFYPEIMEVFLYEEKKHLRETALFTSHSVEKSPAIQMVRGKHAQFTLALLLFTSEILYALVKVITG